MESSDKGGKKKSDAKLSLRRKGKKDGSNNKQGSRTKIPVVDQLNETGEFSSAIPSQFKRGPQSGKLKEMLVLTEDSDDSDVVNEVVQCQVCQKNISHMNSQRRQQHVNRCIDKQEAAEREIREQKEMLEAAKTVTLNCPMCGKVCNTQSSRQSHMKKCSKELGVSTERVIQLVKDQETERDKRLTQGIIPPDIIAKLTKVTTKKKQQVREPRSQFEEDLQVAKAISSSMSIPSSDYDSGESTTRKGKHKKKQCYEDVCLLTTLNDEAKRQRIERKISDILNSEVTVVENMDEKCLYKSTLHPPDTTVTRALWEKANIGPEKSTRDLFYVKEIMPPVCVRKRDVGRNLKRLSCIPGREKSFTVDQSFSVNQSFSNKATGSKMAPTGDGMSSSPEEIITVSTQTVAVLAEMAREESTAGTSQVELEVGQEEQCLQASGFCIEALTLQQEHQSSCFHQLSEDFKQMVNNKDYSDVRIRSKDGKMFYAHRIILAARCKQLLEMQQGSQIELEVSSATVDSLLKFIYSGELTLPPHARSELSFIANKLGLNALLDACDKLVLESECEGNDLNTDDSTKEFNVETEIDLKEIWGESDSENDDEFSAKNDPNNSRGNSTGGQSSDKNDSDVKEKCIKDDRSLTSDAYSETDVEDCGKLNESPGKKVKVEGVDNDSDETEEKPKRVYKHLERIIELKANVKEDVKGGIIGKVKSEDEKCVIVKVESEDKLEVENEEPESDEDVTDTSKDEVNGKTEMLKEPFDVTEPLAKRIRLSEDVVIDKDRDNSKLGTSCESSSSSKGERNTPDISVMDTSCNVSTEDLFVSPTPKRSLCCESGFKLKSFRNASSSGSSNSLSDSIGKFKPINKGLDESGKNQTAHFHSSTPCDKQTASFSRYRPMVSEIPSIKDANPIICDSEMDVDCLENDKANCDNSESDKRFANDIVGVDKSKIDKRIKLDKVEINDEVNEIIEIDREELNEVEINEVYDEIDEADEVIDCDKNNAVDNDVNITNEIDTKDEKSAFDSDDDVQITGDNLSEVNCSNGQGHSPVFARTMSNKPSENKDSYRKTRITTTPESTCIVDDDEVNAEHRNSVFDSNSGESSKGLKYTDADINIESDNEVMPSQVVDEIRDSLDKDRTCVERKCKTGAKLSKSDSVSLNQTLEIDVEVAIKSGKHRNEYSGKHRNEQLYKKSENIHSSKRNINISQTTDSVPLDKTSAEASESESQASEIVLITEDEDDSGGDGEEMDTDAGNKTLVDDKDDDEAESLNTNMETDVWDDFDDCGIVFYPSPEIPIQAPTVVKLSDDGVTHESEDVAPAADDDNLGGAVCLGDSMFQDGDDSFLMRVPEQAYPVPTSKVKVTSQTADFRTPTSNKPTQRKGKKKWVPPSPFTPMPEYRQMSSPALKKELQRYGVKQVSKKRMVNVLEDIYKQTHQYETDSECEEATVDEHGDDEEDSLSDHISPSQATSLSSSQPEYSDEESDRPEILEESCINVSCSDSDTQLSPQKGVDVNKKLMEYIRKDEDLHVRVLMYEPLELDVLKKNIKEAGIKCSMNKLMDFLDEKCIAFTNKNTRKQPASRRGRGKKTVRGQNKQTKAGKS